MNKGIIVIAGLVLGLTGTMPLAHAQLVAQPQPKAHGQIDGVLA